MQHYAIIGAGITGLTIARIMQEKGHTVKVFETEKKPGGLIRCSREKGDVLYHRVGGHVFNSRRQDVLDWFWALFDKESDFRLATRRAEIYFNPECWVPYPIENHLRDLPEETRHQVVDELLTVLKNGSTDVDNLGDFFQTRFGKTLNEIYFTPYNDKIWQMDCKKIPLSWLDGKLPLPSIRDVLINNIDQVTEMKMVHSSFYYPKQGGSQFLANRMAEGIDVVYNAAISQIGRKAEQWLVEGEVFDKVIFTGNIKQLPNLLNQAMPLEDSFISGIEKLEYHGTCSVLCHLKPNDYSWVYIPNPQLKSHRVICTGNFSPHNNGSCEMTGTVEFSCPMSKEDILEQLSFMPFEPEYISHHWEPCTYPIAGVEGKQLIDKIKEQYEAKGFYLLGRFAEWEYYNMDAAIGAALDWAGSFK